MTASTTEIGLDYEYMSTPALPLAIGVKALANTLACYDTATNTVKPGVSGNATLKPIGRFEQTIDNTAGSATVGVLVRLFREVRIDYWINDTGTPITTVFSTAYILDNQTVTGSATGNSQAGTVWKIDSIKGIGVAAAPF